MDAHRQFLSCTTPQKIFWKIYFLYDLVCTNLFVPSHFWATDANFDNCCQHYIATCGKNLYRCTSTFWILKYRGEIFFLNLSAIYTKWCAQTFLPIWGVFAISTTISRKLWLHLATKNANYVVHLKGQSLPKKTLKTASKSTHEHWCNTCSKYTPLNEQRAGLGAWQKKTNRQTIFSHLQPARVVQSPQTLRGGRGRLDHSKRCHSFFDLTHSFSYMEKFGINDWRAVSLQ